MRRGNRLKIEKLARKAAKVMKELEGMKPLYTELDRLTAELIDLGMESVSLGKNKMVLIDNFSEKNTVFRPAAVRRFELKKVV